MEKLPEGVYLAPPRRYLGLSPKTELQIDLP